MHLVGLNSKTKQKERCALMLDWLLSLCAVVDPSKAIMQVDYATLCYTVFSSSSLVHVQW